jgi:iron complex outermembrane receptor protein
VVSRGFEPQHTQDPMYGGPFDAQITEQWEVGAKNESFSGRLISSVAVYNVKRTNALVADPDNPPRLLQIGETTAKGFEFDIAGNVQRSLSIVANYSYNDIRITRTTQNNLGSRPTSQPYHLAGGFVKYTIPSGVVKGLGIGAGASYASKGTHASLQLPEYTTVDAALYYAFGNWNIGLNLYNAFDKRYYHSVGSSIQVYPGMPRNWMARLGIAL